MFHILRSLTLALLVGLFGTIARADITVLSPAKPVSMVTRCNTLELAREIVAAYAVSDESGKAAAEKRYDQITQYGKRLCNPVVNSPIFISQIEVVDKATNVISLRGSSVQMRVAEVRLGMNTAEATDIGFLVIPEAMATLLVGEEM